MTPEPGSQEGAPREPATVDELRKRVAACQQRYDEARGRADEVRKDLEAGMVSEDQLQRAFQNRSEAQRSLEDATGALRIAEEGQVEK
ncbi:MAG: hypothetical protein HY980_02275 [Candidatus Magasanikbacteria bacterium]|nr:hypothetical protein [Candidatus Magasanikbacteria bacterium]